MAHGNDDISISGGAIGRQLRSCASAFTFLTRLPAGRIVEHDVTDLSGAVVYFPVVGLIVGVIGALVFGAAVAIWTPVLAVIMSVASVTWTTGAFHEDALADSFDGFGGGWEPARILAIMKDSRVGSYAVVGMILVLAARIGALWSIFNLAQASGADASTGASTGAGAGALAVGVALVAAHVLGRWSSVVLIASHPYVRIQTDDAKPAAGRPFTGNVTHSQVVAATLLAFIVSAAVLRWKVILVALAAAAITLVAGRYFVARIGGITGDALGAANQFVELAVYLVLAAHT